MQTESIATNVIPRLVVNHRRASFAAARPASGNEQAARLARLLIAPDVSDARALIDHALTAASSPAQLYAELFEPAARCLGDLWNVDDCTEFDVTIGLCHLQSAMRRICFDHPATPLTRAAPRQVLVAPQPGEPHLLSAALNAELLGQVGWHVYCEFPDTNKTLCEVIGSHWFDAMNLSLSPAMRREHWLPRMAETIRQLRRASRNPTVAIVVSGRVFAERHDAAEDVGADAAVRSGLQVEQMILRVLMAGNASRSPSFAWS